MTRLRAALALLLTAAIVGAVAVVLADGRADRGDVTVFGATVASRPGESATAAAERASREIGTPPIVRLFSSSRPEPWPKITGLAGSADVVVSFKVAPREVLDGDVDAYLRDWFAQAPTDRDVYWVYFHEPEDDIERGAFTADEFVRAWEHIDRIADKAHSPRLISTVVLMCWTARADSTRRWSAYVPGDPPDVLAWDCYNAAARDGEYASPAAILDASQQLSGRAGSAWAIAELGSKLAVGDDGSGRAQWLREVASYSRRNDAAFVTYFNSSVGGEFELEDAPSQRAWREIMARH